MRTNPLSITAQSNAEGGAPVGADRESLVDQAFEMLGRVVDAGLQAAGVVMDPEAAATQNSRAEALSREELRDIGHVAATVAAVGLAIAGGRKVISMVGDAVAKRRAA